MFAEIAIAAASVAAAGAGGLLLRRWMAARKKPRDVEVTVANGARALLALRINVEPWTGGWMDVEARHDLAVTLNLAEIQFGKVNGYEGLHLPNVEPPPPENNSTAAIVAHDRAHKAALADWLGSGARYTLTERCARMAITVAQRTPLPAELAPAAVILVRDLRSALGDA